MYVEVIQAIVSIIFFAMWAMIAQLSVGGRSSVDRAPKP